MTLGRAVGLGTGLLLSGCLVLAGCQLLSGGAELHTAVGAGGDGGASTGGSSAGGSNAGGSSGMGGMGGGGGCGPANPQSYQALVLSDCPVAYFRLGEAPCRGPDCMAANLGTGSQVGSYQNNCILGEPGALDDGDTAVLIDEDTDGHIDVLPPLSFPNMTPFSLEIWVKPSLRVFEQSPGECVTGGLLTHEGDDRLCGTNNFPGYRLVLRPDCDIEFELQECNGPRVEVRSEPLGQSRWYHVVATFDGSEPKLYLDGVQVGDPVIGDLPQLADDQSVPFTIGGRRYGNWGQLDGWLDEAAVYDLALPAGRIAAHYAASGR